MIHTRSVAPALICCCLLAFCAGSVTVYAGSSVEEQEKDNDRWKDNAEEKQKRYYDRGREYEKDKEYSKAIREYKKVLRIYYSEWQFTREAKTYKTTGVETEYMPATRKKRIRLKGSTYDQAKDRIKKLQGKRVTDSLKDLSDAANEAYREKNYGEAYKLYGELAERSKRSTERSADNYARRAESRVKTLETNASKALDKVRKSLGDEKLEQALADFVEFEERYGSFPANEVIHNRYVQISKNPALRKAKGDVDARSHLEAARDYLEKKQYAYAYYEYHLIRQEFPEADAAQEAARGIQEMQENPEVFQAIHKVPRDRYARELIRRADDELDENDTIAATRLYKYVYVRFADCVASYNRARMNLRKLQPDLVMP
jgi:hypothetical protein